MAMGGGRLVLCQCSNLKGRENLSLLQNLWKPRNTSDWSTLNHMISAQAPALRLECVVLSWATLPVAAVGVNQFSRRRQTKINVGCT